MRSGERVAYIQISQRRELLNDLRKRLLLVVQGELEFEQGLLFGAKSHIVQQQDIAIF
ncbi:hypothetical protein SDC9_142563 [bioreactor metagenome]|uniref:Uncharacterized protein n=1 Tax=bioreactor metagenome TaxID=1076179 RepID=A0A645E1I1_9ZZZZ